MNNITQLNDEQLRRRKEMLDIAKFEQDLQIDRERFELDKARYEFERQQDRERFEQERKRSDAETEKYRAETATLNKENRFYPMLTITMGVVAVIGGIVAGLITKLF